MNYNEILDEITPNQEENTKVHKIANNIMDTINNIIHNESIDGEAILLGSVAKDTWLSGTADIDVFIKFSLDMSMDELKEKGLYLGYKCSEALNVIAEEHYASHPYLTLYVSNYKVDIVPCYDIEDACELKSAVDRTVLHTNYIKANLKDNQKNEVRILKKFMKETGVYGSEFKVGGFAGYLCEMLILHYGTFENTLENASTWVHGTVIDIENYKTDAQFDDGLIAIDPTDKNRNVGAALTKEKMIEFIVSSRNFIKNPRIDYFYSIEKTNLDYKNLLKSFKDRESKIITISFDVPDISIDNIYPQLNKTTISIDEKLEDLGFNIINSSYWYGEGEIAIIILEFDTWALSKYETHFGPKIWNKKASDDFLDMYGDKCYIEREFWALKRERKFRTPEKFFGHVFNKENIHILKIGKNLKELIINTNEIKSIEELLKDNKHYNKDNLLNFLYDYLNPGQLLKR